MLGHSSNHTASEDRPALEVDLFHFCLISCIHHLLGVTRGVILTGDRTHWVFKMGPSPHQ